MIGEPRRHRRTPLLPSTLGSVEGQRPHRPAEVVAVQAQVRHRLVIPPVLAESVRLSGLPGVAVAVRPVLPLDERRVDRPARPAPPPTPAPPPPPSPTPPACRSRRPGPSHAASSPPHSSAPPAGPCT